MWIDHIIEYTDVVGFKKSIEYFGVRRKVGVVVKLHWFTGICIMLVIHLYLFYSSYLDSTRDLNSALFGTGIVVAVL